MSSRENRVDQFELVKQFRQIFEGVTEPYTLALILSIPLKYYPYFEDT